MRRDGLGSGGRTVLEEGGGVEPVSSRGGVEEAELVAFFGYGKVE